MAQKFNEGQTFGEIRAILNANADELTATTAKATQAATVASDASSLAGPLADGNTQGRASGGPYPTAGVTPSGLTHNIAFSAGLGMVIAPLLQTGYSLKQAVLDFAEAGIQVTFRLNGTYTGGWTPSGNISGVGFLSIYPNGVAIAAMGIANPVAYRGMHVFISGGWESILSPSSVAASLDMDGADEEPSSGGAVPRAPEASEASEASEAEETGKEAADV